MSEEATPQLQSSHDQDHTATPPPRRLWLHLGLFAATCVTTTWVGVLMVHPNVGALDLAALLPLVPDGLPYSVAILAILLTHEMGHYVAARVHGVSATLPYFLPLPLQPVGTLGAVIRISGVIRSRDALVDIGAAGPLAGLVVALPVLALGIHLSPVEAIPAVGMQEGNSLIYLALKWVVKGAPYPVGGKDVMLHPTAWAGWVGLLVTMINLLPIGQLDGGHIAYGYLGPQHNRFSLWLHRALPLLALGCSAYTILDLSRAMPLGQAMAEGWQAGVHWLVWGALLLFMRHASGGQYHPPVEGPPLSRGRKWVCALVLVAFLLILTPIPLRPSVGLGAP